VGIRDLGVSEDSTIQGLNDYGFLAGASVGYFNDAN
jgi:hypothetical protein